jgi:hypothetical protein
MIDVYMVMTLLILHFIGDFILQTDKMALNKSKSVKWLTIHVVVYTIPFLLINWLYALINGVLHWIVDYVTSRQAAMFHRKGQRSMFFKIIGLDQLLHGIILIFTYYWMETNEYFIPWLF